MIFVTFGIFKVNDLIFNLIWNGCHDVLIMPLNLSDITILNISSADYRCTINEICKSEVINLMQIM